MKPRPVDCRRSKPNILITLDCGCKIKTRDSPFSPNAKFGCTSGLGHGYNRGWVGWTTGPDDIFRTNPKLADTK